MKKLRIVLIVLSAIYVVLTIAFMLNDESLFNRFNLLNLINYLQVWIIVGLVLLIGVIMSGTLYIRSLIARNKKLEKEFNAVKARLYDIEEERKTGIARSKAEEEETEQKLEAFNQSLKNQDKSNKENPGPEKPAKEKPGKGGPAPEGDQPA